MKNISNGFGSHENGHDTPIREAIIPIAGLSTRTRPMHRFYGKEFAFVGSTPLIEHLMHEAADAGIQKVAVIINSKKQEMWCAYRDMLEHAEQDFEGNEPMINRLKAQREMTFTTVVADHTKADGESIMQVNEYWMSGDVPIAVLFGDDFILDPSSGNPVGLRELMEAKAHTNGSTNAMIALQTLPPTEAHKYGILRTAQETRDRLFGVQKLVEKPNADRLREMFDGTIPEKLHTIVGKYIISPQTLTNLRRLGSDKQTLAKGLRLADALSTTVEQNGGVYGHEFAGRRFDTGNLKGIQAMERFLLEKTLTSQS